MLQTAVALKLIDSTDAARERILTEVRLARQITHPAICRVFDVGEADGGDLSTRWSWFGAKIWPRSSAGSGRLPSERVVDIARQLCAGWPPRTRTAILHRDLKPANVLIDEDGLVRITDFGIAIPGPTPSSHMQTGTPRYMAPEQRAEGTLLLRADTDVYALGLVLLRAARRAGHLQPRCRAAGALPNHRHSFRRSIRNSSASSRRRSHAIPPSGLRLLPKWRQVCRTSVATATRRPPRLGWRGTPRWIAAAALASVVGILAVASSYLRRPHRAHADRAGLHRDRRFRQRDR